MATASPAAAEAEADPEPEHELPPAEAAETADGEAEPQLQDDEPAPAEEASSPPPEAEDEPAAPSEQTPVTEKKKRSRRGSLVVRSEEKVERPSRERKKVERYAALTPRSSTTKKAVSIVQGSGMKLKDIPNVAFKLSKRKVDENLQNLHVILYGKKSNIHYLKRNLSQFSGFVWMENKDKHKARVKDKIDKINKEKLLDFCEILDIQVSKANARKEEISAKLFDFLESPHITRDIILTDDGKTRKRTRRSKANIDGKSDDVSADQVQKRRKRVKKSEEVEKDDMDLDDEEDQNDDDDDDDDDDGHDAEEDEDDGDVRVPENSSGHKVDDSEKNENGGSDQDEEDDELEEDDSAEKKPSTTQSADASTGKNTNSPTKKAPNASKAHKSATKHEEQVEDEVTTGASKGLKDKDISAEEDNKRTKTPRAVKKEDKKAGPSAKASNNKASKRATKVEQKSPRKLGKRKPRGALSPTGEEIRAVLTTLLKEVDFNTATLSDILRQLGAHFKVDLMSRKVEIKSLIEEVINSMSDFEDDDEEDEKEGGGAQDGDEEAGDGEDGDDGDDDN